LVGVLGLNAMQQLHLLLQAVPKFSIQHWPAKRTISNRHHTCVDI